MTIVDKKRAQVAKQCEAVAYMATALASVNTDFAKMFRAGHMDDLIEQVGPRTAHLMEVLGDILNGMDAVDKKDKWLDPVFEQAHRFWPTRERKS